MDVQSNFAMLITDSARKKIEERSKPVQQVWDGKDLRAINREIRKISLSPDSYRMRLR